jgi:mono/diheme cytochrome c family protein
MVGSKSGPLWVLLCGAAIALLAGVMPAGSQTPGTKTPAAKPAPAASKPVFQTASTFVSAHCVQCHSAKSKKGGLNLEQYKDEAALVKDRKIWEKVLTVVRAGDMPPATRPRPRNEDTDAFIRYLEVALYQLDCVNRRDPGRVTIRRLNRTEYNNTIRDLVGVNFRPAEDFPADDVGYGFDNIGDVLSLPPILMEKYLTAAETIIERAFAGDPTKPAPKRYEAEELKMIGTGRLQGTQARTLTGNGEIFVEHKFAADGEYNLRFRGFGRQVGPEPVKSAILLDGTEIKPLEVKANENKSQIYEARAPVKAGVRKVSANFQNEFRDPKEKDRRKQERGLSVLYMEIEGPLGAGVTPTGPQLVTARKPGQNRKDWYRENVQRFAGRAFRRPATTAETDKLMRFFDVAEREGESPEKGLQLAYTAVLVSPHFLFRIEADQEPNNPAAIHAITEFELATRLSYFLWSTMPDEELFGLAEKGELRKNLDAQLARMLKDPRSRTLTENFAAQWLQIRNLRTISPDTKLFPNWDERLRSAMARETELFFEAVVGEDRSILDFLDADFTFVNERLARHYGIPNVRGEQFQRVKLPDNRRGGVLTHASILTITSNPTRTSPVKRGKWILEQILGTPPPPPPPGVDELREDEKTVLSGSLRQRMEQHRANPNCAVCHTKMDALGFGFENFDAVGAWRTQDGKFTIDASGTLPGGKNFKTPAELRGILKENKDAFARCFAEKLLTYALGRGLEYYDRCALDDIGKTADRNNFRFSVFVSAIVKSDPFQKRRGK